MALVMVYKTPSATPTFTAGATISGTLEAANVLTCAYTVTGSNGEVVRWYRHTADDGSDPTGTLIGEGLTYLLTSNENGFHIRVIVTATNAAGSETSTSAYTGQVTAPQPPEPPSFTSPVTILGTAQVNQELSVSYGHSGAVTIAVSWFSYLTEDKQEPIALGTGSSITLTPSEADRWIGVIVTLSNEIGDTSGEAIVPMDGIDPYQPLLPEEYAVPAYSLPVGGTTWTPADSAELRTALASCQRGDVIVLDADTTYTGRFNITERPGTGWVYVISSRMADLPGDGERVTCGWEATRQGVSDDSANMPTLLFTEYNTANSARHGLWFYNGEGGSSFQSYNASYWRFCGLELSIQVDEAELQYSMVRVYGDNIVFDRCYLHGSPGDNRWNRDGFGFYLNGAQAVINSHVSDFKGEGMEAHAFQINSGAGPRLIENNFISSSGIPVFIGDNYDPYWARIQNVVIRGNHVYKPDTYNRLSGEWDGINHLVKNMLEVKSGTRILIEGNLFENSYQGADQSGQWVYFKPSAGEAPITDITVRNNLAVKCNNWGLANYSGAPLERILVQNNLCYKIGGRGITTTGKYWWVIHSSGKYVTVENNTSYYPDRTLYDGLWLWAGARYTTVSGNYWRVRNNVLHAGAAYDFKGASGGNGQPAMDQYCGPEMQFVNNVLLNGRSGSSYTNYPTAKEADYWDFWYFPTSATAVGFSSTDFNSIDDFELSALSPYAAIGTNNSKPGINAAAMSAMLNDALPA